MTTAKKLNTPLIETIGLSKEFPSRDAKGLGLLAVDRVTLSIDEGEVFGIVGESGSGKSTLARCIFGITQPSAGVVKIFGETVVDESPRKSRDRRSKLGFVFQDPVASLNPRMTIQDVIAEPLELHTQDKDFIEARVLTLVERVGLGKTHLKRRAHELSGGQCQRVAIARALSTNPKAILLDEPTSSLDLSVQAQILNLLEDLRREFGLTYFLISHNLDVIAHLSDRMAVMSMGKVVEMGSTRSIMESPKHPFTKELLGAHSSRKTSASIVDTFDLDLWQDAPLNRWAFQHVDEFISVEEIAKSDHPHAWEKDLDSRIESLSIPYGDQVVAFNEMLEELKTDSMLVLRKGKIVYENYFNEMRADSHHLLQSVSKSVLGILAGKLIDEGLIDPTRTLGSYLPELKGSGFFDALVQDALNMTVAVKFSEEYHEVDSEIQELDRVAGWRHRRIGDATGIREFLKTITPSGKHGEQFQYCSANTDLLAWLFSDVSGESYPELIASRIWGPIGATAAATITVDPNGHPLANGGISATTRDLGLIGQLVLESGCLDGNQIVPANWIAKTMAGAPSYVKTVDYMQALHPGGSYKNQWWVTSGDHSEIYGVGIFGQYLWVDPISEMVIVKFSTLSVATSAEHSRKHVALFKAIGHLD